MKKYIEFFKNCCMWVTLIMMLIHPHTAFGYLVIAILAGIGVFQLIDKVRG